MTPNLTNIAFIVTASVVIIGLGGALALYLGRRATTSADWVVAGRSLPLYVVVFTQFATAVGGGVLVAHVGIAYAWGLSVFAYEAFVLVGFLILTVIARWLRRQEFSTIPDILGRLFGPSSTVRSIAAVCTVVVPFGWLATQFVAFGKLFSDITGIPVTALIVVIAALSLVFVLPGGLLSVSWTDFLFGLLMVVISVVVGAYAVSMAGGFGSIAQRVPGEVWQFPSGLGAAGVTTILLWLFAIVPGTLTNQLYYQRVYAQGNIRRVRQGLVLSGIMTLLAGVYASLIGLSVRAMNPGLGVEGREQAAGWFLGQIPRWLLALYAAFLMATIISTTGSALQSVVTNLVRDLYQRVFARKRGERELVSLSKMLTVVVTAVAALLAAVYPQALDWLVATYAYSASSLAAPIFVGYALRNRRQLTPAVALAGLLGGLLGAATAHIAGTSVPYVVYGMATSVVCVCVAAYLAGRRSGESDAAVDMRDGSSPRT